MGAYPLTSPSALTVDFHSRNLGEFDTVLRSLGVKRNGKTGTAALPVALAGQADFHGTWAGSLANPRLSGNLKATDLALEMAVAIPVAAPFAKPADAAPPGQPQRSHNPFIWIPSILPEATRPLES